MNEGTRNTKGSLRDSVGKKGKLKHPNSSQNAPQYPSLEIMKHLNFSETLGEYCDTVLP